LNILSGARKFQDNCSNFLFISLNDGILKNTEDSSDEDQYKNFLYFNQILSDFEEAKTCYILFATQLIAFHKNIEKVSEELNYLYSTTFQALDKSHIFQHSSVFHFALFYEIVLSNDWIQVCLYFQIYNRKQ